MGRAVGKPFDARRGGLTWADVVWHEPGVGSHTRAGCTVFLCNVKDVEGAGKRYPLPIARRGLPGAPFDPVCAYDALRAAFDEDVRLLGRDEARRGPIFRRTLRGGADDAVDTNDVRAAVRDVASAAGEAALDEFGAHSARIGGASDLHDRLASRSPPVDSRPLIKARGRWRSDIYHVYTRSALATAMGATAGMVDVDSVEMEAIFSGWTEPA